uniref:Interleukin 34 n=1 Tax=Sphaeramia orbicularis TaxID=375764 RepID=A0A672YJQ1_9TELE
MSIKNKLPKKKKKCHLRLKYCVCKGYICSCKTNSVTSLTDLFFALCVFQKHNFPINYTIRVHYEEVFKLSNINRMRLNIEDLDELVLQRLWFQVNQGVLKKILRVMSERHPSRPYTAELERRLQDAEGVFVQSHPDEAFQQELPDAVQDIWDRLTEEPDKVPESSWRFVSPKSLLDNFCRTMHCLFSKCFSGSEGEQDYCSVSHWRKGRKKHSKPQS